MHPIEWLRAVARHDGASQRELATEAAAALAAVADDPRELLLACRRLLDRHPTSGSLWWVCARMLVAADPVQEARELQQHLDGDQVGLSLAIDLPEDAGVAMIGWSDLADELTVRRGDLRLYVVTDRGADELPQPKRNRRWPRPVRGDDEPDEDGSDIYPVPPLGLGTAVLRSSILLAEAWAVGKERFVAPAGTLAAVGAAKLVPIPVWLAVPVGRSLPDAMFDAMRLRLRVWDEPWLDDVDVVELRHVKRIVEPQSLFCPEPAELLSRRNRH